MTETLSEGSMRREGMFYPIFFFFLSCFFSPVETSLSLSIVSPELCLPSLGLILLDILWKCRIQDEYISIMSWSRVSLLFIFLLTLHKPRRNDDLLRLTSSSCSSGESYLKIKNNELTSKYWTRKPAYSMLQPQIFVLSKFLVIIMAYLL